MLMVGETSDKNCYREEIRFTQSVLLPTMFFMLAASIIP